MHRPNSVKTNRIDPWFFAVTVRICCNPPRFVRQAVAVCTVFCSVIGACRNVNSDGTPTGRWLPRRVDTRRSPESGPPASGQASYCLLGRDPFDGLHMTDARRQDESQLAAFCFLVEHHGSNNVLGALTEIGRDPRSPFRRRQPQRHQGSRPIVPQLRRQ